MAPVILRSQPGIKRDGTSFDGENYTDGQWVRFQRGLPRKMAGYQSISKYLTEVSRGFAAFTQQSLIYCHSGSASFLERFTLDGSGNASIISNRTPVAVAATGTVTLTSGAAGSVDMITVNGVNMMSAAVPFNTDLTTTAADVVTNVNAHQLNYVASSVGAVITLTAATATDDTNGYAVVATTTTIVASDTDMAGGSDALTTSSNNMWMFDYMYDSSTTANSVVAHVAPNSTCICGDTGGEIFYGSVTATASLKSIRLPAGANATGGIVVLHPYMFYYGTAGIVGWSVPGDPTDLEGSGSGIARVWGQKIVKGLPLRAGAGSSPSGIFWAYDAVIRASYVGGSAIFQFDTIATDTSILSSNCVIDYDGVFYWAGVDRFLMFSGVVREVPNQLNLNWFFDNLNRSASQKVFAFKVPKYGEIWWCYPRGSATECSHAVIYNVRENTWYDTELPSGGRSAGLFANAYAAPILTGASVSASGYKVWRHELGTDEVDGSTTNPIESWFTTADISAVAKGDDAALRIDRIEPDFVQEGDLEVSILGRINARAPEVTGTSFTFSDTATSPQEQTVMLKEQRRELRVKFYSNTAGGDYQMGQIIAHIGNADRTHIG